MEVLGYCFVYPNRTVLLRLASLGVLMGSLYDKLTGHMTQRVDINNTVCDNLQPTYNTTEPDQMVSRKTCPQGPRL